MGLSWGEQAEEGAKPAVFSGEQQGGNAPGNELPGTAPLETHPGSPGD